MTASPCAPVALKAHLLRHAFATHAVQIEKIPIDIVGEWLKQKNLDVTDYYSQPTDSLVAEAADRYLARIAAHVHVGEAVRRSPLELRPSTRPPAARSAPSPRSSADTASAMASAPPSSPASAA